MDSVCVPYWLVADGLGECRMCMSKIACVPHPARTGWMRRTRTMDEDDDGDVVDGAFHFKLFT